MIQTQIQFTYAANNCLMFRFKNEMKKRKEMSKQIILWQKKKKIYVND